MARIVSVDPGKEPTGTITGAFMSYVLVPQDDDTTRLLLKVVMQTTRWAIPQPARTQVSRAEWGTLIGRTELRSERSQ